MKLDEILHKFRTESFTQKDKGTRFERLMSLWLLSDPRYYMLTKVWLWEDFPSKADFGGKDTGIDLVARTDSGDYWATQCKYYKEHATIDKPASSAAKTQARYKDFSNRLCSETGMNNAYDSMQVVSSSTKKKFGGSGISADNVSFDASFFRSKYVLLFDDVITKGDSML